MTDFVTLHRNELRDLLAAIDRLTEQVTELQQRGTELVEARRAAERERDAALKQRTEQADPSEKIAIKNLQEAVAELQLSRPLSCYDCGRRYERGPDLHVSREDWLKVAPMPEGGGVLCPNCMHDRFVALGVPSGSVVATFGSGPFAGAYPEEST
jgi:hypothetical protein